MVKKLSISQFKEKNQLAIQRSLFQRWKETYGKTSDSIDLANYVTLSDNLPNQIILDNLKDINQILMPIVIPFMEKINSMEMKILDLKENIEELKEKQRENDLEKIKEESSSNSQMLRELFGIPQTSREINPKVNIESIFSEYDQEDDSLETLHELRE